MKRINPIATTPIALMLCFGSTVFAGHGLPGAVTEADFRVHTEAKVELGRLLMFDKILSGNMNISCATCHHPLTDTGDGLSLPVGEGGIGLGVTRNTGIGDDAVHERVPRNAPPVFNLGAHEFQVLFHDGRVTVNPEFPSNCETPAGHQLPNNLDNVLACQAMFPVTSPTEMAGQVNVKDEYEAENPIAAAAHEGRLAGEGGVWDLLAKRLRDPDNGYADLFIDAFDDIGSAQDITYAHAANAIAAFEGTAWRADNSPFDSYLRGNKKAMSKDAVQGMQLFYKGSHVNGGQACATCHMGKFQTDHGFHNIAMPQIGAGRGSNSTDGDAHEDFGREQVTGVVADIFKFRTPTLRNVALTAPYGHAGAYNTLRAAVEHHLDPVAALRKYDQEQAVLPSRADLDADDFRVMNDQEGRLRFMIEEYETQYEEPMNLRYTPAEVDLILEFLNALTDPSSIDLRSDTPTSVPSGLPLYE